MALTRIYGPSNPDASATIETDLVACRGALQVNLYVRAMGGGMIDSSAVFFSVYQNGGKGADVAQAGLQVLGHEVPGNTLIPGDAEQIGAMIIVPLASIRSIAVPAIGLRLVIGAEPPTDLEVWSEIVWDREPTMLQLI